MDSRPSQLANEAADITPVDVVKPAGERISFGDRVKAAAEKADLKEKERSQQREEAAKARKEKWDNFVGGIKNSIKRFQDWDKKGGEQIRKAVDMMPAVKDAAVLTAQEKALQAMNAGAEIGNQVAGKVMEATEAVGKFGVDVAVVTLEVGVYAALVTAEVGVEIVQSMAEATVDGAKK